MPKNIGFKNNCLGSSLIEIMVALFILASGLLGLASMQMLSLKNVSNAQFHSLATSYAYDMAERMRSNREAVSAGGYNNIVATVSEPSCTTCSSAQMAELDGFLWNKKIQSDVNDGGLPGGTGTVQRVGSIYKIVVAWEEQKRSNTGGSVGSTSFVLNIQI